MARLRVDPARRRSAGVDGHAGRRPGPGRRPACRPPTGCATTSPTARGSSSARAAPSPSSRPTSRSSCPSRTAATLAAVARGGRRPGSPASAPTRGSTPSRRVDRVHAPIGGQARMDEGQTTKVPRTKKGEWRPAAGRRRTRVPRLVGDARWLRPSVRRCGRRPMRSSTSAATRLRRRPSTVDRQSLDVAVAASHAWIGARASAGRDRASGAHRHRPGPAHVV